MREPTRPLAADDEPLVTASLWRPLKQFTSARIALGRAGNSVPSTELLAFQLDHARAIDAVHKALDVQALYQQLARSSILQAATSELPQKVESKAADRMVYLQRPDLGRQLTEACWQQLREHAIEAGREYDLAIVVADGLSSTAIAHHAVAVTERLVAKLSKDKSHRWSLAPITIVTQGRVALGDDIGECLRAKLTLIMIGERPGLTSPDSLGIYMTWQPKRGVKESSRNCISNIRPEGLGYDDAAEKAFYLLSESMRLQLSGIQLKDRSVQEEEQVGLNSSSATHFLISSDDQRGRS